MTSKLELLKCQLLSTDCSVQVPMETRPQGSERLGGTPPHCCLLVPCFREIFQAGPSRDRSTSIWLSLVALPRVIWGNGAGRGLGPEEWVYTGPGKMREQGPDTERSRRARLEEEGKQGKQRQGPPYLSRAHQVPHHAAPQHCQSLVVKVRRAHACEGEQVSGRARLRAPGWKEGAGAWEMRAQPASHAQGLWVGRRELEHDSHPYPTRISPPASPVMLSTSTCHLCSSCSSCRISRFWRRSATVSSGVRQGGKQGCSEVTSTSY